MSVAATRWAIDYLRTQPMPDRGGLSADARAVLLVLAGHAGYPPNGVGPHIAKVGASTIGEILGRHERTVRGWLNELEARTVLPVIRRPGRTAEWVFVIAPMSTTPGAYARGPLSTTPGENTVNPGRARPTKGGGDVVTSTDAVPRGAPVAVSVSLDHVPAGAGWDDGYYAPVPNDGRPAEIR